MEWTRTDTLALASSSCSTCHGLGLPLGKRQSKNPCNCVLRTIFRACYARFRYCVTKEKHMSRVTLSYTRGRERSTSWGRKNEEYCADFILVSRRALNEQEHQIFKYHFLLGADWRLCCRKLKMSRGNFFHAVYRIQQKLGRVYRELQPYGLYPLDEYFATTIQPTEPVAISPGAATGAPLEPPLQRAA